jgi:glycosyltransferase involved in cell wall biosynthesis
MRLFDIRSLGHVVFERTNDGNADVVVIISLCNYENYIEECLESLVNQSMRHFSVVVVDDCSTDQGEAVAYQFLNAHAKRFSTARLVRHFRNQGLSMARNSGIAWSSEPLVFVLDADNRIRPPALARLRSAIEFCQADFAYSQLFVLGEESTVGCADIWHLNRLRYRCEIDAMAMVRRSALLDAGGYAALANEHGCEDYDLWCRFAMLGFRGIFVPELLCESRRPSSSTYQNRTKHFDALMAEMTVRYPEIFVPDAKIAGVEEDFSAAVPFDWVPAEIPQVPKVAVVMHMFAEGLLSEFQRYFLNIPFGFDLYISTDSHEKKNLIERAFEKRGNGRTEVRLTPRYGRDIAPRLLGFRDIYAEYELVLLLHSKVSSHSLPLAGWRRHLLENLIGSPGVVSSILEIFCQRPDVGIVSAQHFEPIRSVLGWGENFDLARSLAARFGTSIYSNDVLDYPSGSMLWVRCAALKPFFDANLTLDDFQADSYGRQLDGTMAHAIERLFYIAAERAGFGWIKVARPDLFEQRSSIEWIRSSDELNDFVIKRSRTLTLSDRSNNAVRPVEESTSVRA